MSMHKDHNNTHLIVPDAQFLASVVECDKIEGARQRLFRIFSPTWSEIC